MSDKISNKYLSDLVRLSKTKKRHHEDEEEELPKISPNLSKKQKSIKLIIDNLVDKYKDKSIDDANGGFEFLSPALPKPPFRIHINGVSGNGKTNLIFNFLVKFYRDQKDGKTLFTGGIIICSPSVMTDPAFAAIAELFEDMIAEGRFQMMLEVDDDAIDQAVSDFNNDEPKLLIIDDNAADATIRKPRFIKSFLRARHNNVSIIITSQMYRLIHKALRLNMSNSMFYNVMNDHELDLIAGEMATNKVSLETLKEEFKKLGSHEFLHHNISKNTWHVGLDELELMNQNVTSESISDKPPPSGGENSIEMLRRKMEQTSLDEDIDKYIAAVEMEGAN